MPRVPSEFACERERQHGADATTTLGVLRPTTALAHAIETDAGQALAVSGKAAVRHDSRLVDDARSAGSVRSATIR